MSDELKQTFQPRHLDATSCQHLTRTLPHSPAPWGNGPDDNPMALPVSCQPSTGQFGSLEACWKGSGEMTSRLVPASSVCVELGAVLVDGAV